MSMNPVTSSMTVASIFGQCGARPERADIDFDEASSVLDDGRIDVEDGSIEGEVGDIDVDDATHLALGITEIALRPPLVLRPVSLKLKGSGADSCARGGRSRPR